MSTSGQDGLRRQNIRGGRSLDPPLRRKDPTRLGDVAPLPVAGCTVNPGAEVHSRVRLRVERERVCDVTVPGGGTTLGKPCGVACWAAVVLVLVVEVTLPVELLLPVPLESPFESSRLNENLFGLRLKLATLFVTISCRELKKLIFVVFYV